MFPSSYRLDSLMRWTDRPPQAGGPFNESAKPSLIAGGYSLNNRGDTPWEAKRKEPSLISTLRRLFAAASNSESRPGGHRTAPIAIAGW